jgi:hypothetical protein
MKNSGKDDGADTSSQLAQTKSKEEKKKKDDAHEIIDTSSKQHDPYYELHNIPRP